MAIDREVVTMNKNMLFERVEKAVQEYNSFMGDAKFQDAKDTLNGAQENLKRLNANVKALVYDDILKFSDPIAEACLRYTYKVYILKEEDVEGSALKVMKLREKDKVIALDDLQKFAKTNNKISIGNDPEWIYAVQHLNYLLTIQVAEELGIDPTEIRDCYRIKDVAKEYRLGIANAADGEAQTLAALDKIIDMMISDDGHYWVRGRVRPGKHEVKFLNRVYSKKGKSCLSVAVSDHKRFCAIIMEIAHKLLTGEAYSVEYKRATR